jgi:TRAP-type C4-dicarboxylate transport system permease small subunit
MIMIGAMLGIYENRHFEVDIWPRLAPRPQAALRLVSNVAVLAMALVFVWAGWYFTSFAWNRISELAELPLWLIHMAWPIAGLTWVLFTGEQMWDNLRTLIWGKPLHAQEDHSTESAV